MTKTRTVMGAYYAMTTVLVTPTVEDCVLVVALEGKTVRGTTYFKEQVLWLSKEFANYQVAEGNVRIAQIIED